MEDVGDCIGAQYASATGELPKEENLLKDTVLLFSTLIALKCSKTTLTSSSLLSLLPSTLSLPLA